MCVSACACVLERVREREGVGAKLRLIESTCMSLKENGFHQEKTRNFLSFFAISTFREKQTLNDLRGTQ